MNDRVLQTIRCPRDGRKMAQLVADSAGTVSLVIVGGRRGDLAAAAEWEDAKGRAALLGVNDPVTGEQIRWWLPSSADPPTTPPCRMRLPDCRGPAALVEFVEMLPPIRIVCPRCHVVDGIILRVSHVSGWSAVLKSDA